jgi:hypothetical protein
MSTMDPEHLDDVDREIRINELKEQARELVGGEMTSSDAGDVPPEAREQFWHNIVEAERGGWTSVRRQLQEAGVVLPGQENLSDAALAAKLDEIFGRLAVRHTFFTHTDHLSDRELYERLVSDLLDEEFPDMLAASPTGAYVIDLVGSGSEEDMQIYHRYYADEEDRQSWLKDFPGDAMPPHEELPYDRDRRLPSPPEGW